MIEFKPWPKIKRYEHKRAPIFTEKLDGTNACVVIEQYKKEGIILLGYHKPVAVVDLENGDGFSMYVQSRTRFISPEEDNYGFAKWVQKNQKELVKLGPGHHFGEWWGQGIQRGYGLEEKRFSLFNTRRWGAHNPNTPSCVSVVPLFSAESVEDAKKLLLTHGSFAVPGYMRPEGAVMYEPDTDTCFKIILDKVKQ